MSDRSVARAVDAAPAALAEPQVLPHQDEPHKNAMGSRLNWLRAWGERLA